MSVSRRQQADSVNESKEIALEYEILDQRLGAILAFTPYVAQAKTLLRSCYDDPVLYVRRGITT
jgi:hypothetical protein